MDLDKQLETSKHITWGPVAAVIVTIATYFGAQIIAGMIIAIYPLLNMWSYERTAKWLESSTVGQFVFVAIVESLTLWMIWIFLKSRKAKISDIGLKKPRSRDVGYALLGFGMYFVLYIIVVQVASRLFPSLDVEQKQELGFNTATSGKMLWLVFVSLVILPPVTEEIVVRGFLYTGLRSKLRIVNAAIITSILFAAAHLQFGSGNALLWVAGLDTLILSFVLIYLREKTDSLWPCIGVHMIKNGLAFTALFIFKVL